MRSELTMRPFGEMSSPSSPTKHSGNTIVPRAIERAARSLRQRGRDTTTASRQFDWRNDNASQDYSRTDRRSLARRCCAGSRIRFRARLSWRLGLGSRWLERRPEPLYQHRRQQLLSAAVGSDPPRHAPAHRQRLRLHLLIDNALRQMETPIASAVGAFLALT